MQQNKNANNAESQQEDFQAIRNILNGNKSAFKILQKKYGRIIVTLIRRMIKDEDDVQDIAQETFIKVYNALPNFQFEYSFSAWIYRIASNNCIDFIRKKKLNIVSLSQPLNPSDEDSEFEIKDDTFNPDLNVLSEERKNAINDAINKLPDNYRKIIKMRHEEEMDYQQIAVSLDIPLGTVKAHLFRARKILLTALKKQKFLFY